MTNEDGITRFTLLGATVRGSLLESTHLAGRARSLHGLGIVESLALSQALSGAALLSTTIKAGETIGLRMDCTGPVRGFSVESTWDARVRGYLFCDAIRLDKPLNSFDLQPFIGSGTLSVRRLAPDGDAYTGHIELVHGRIAEDVTEYFLRSEQTRTALALSVRFDPQGRIVGAGGLFLQALPGAKEVDMEDAEVRLSELPSLGTWFAEGKSRSALLSTWFDAFEVDVLAETPAAFECSCSRERFYSFLGALGADELWATLAEGPLPLEIVCHYCSRRYRFDRSELEQLLYAKG